MIGTVNWTGIATFITSISTFLGVVIAAWRTKAVKKEATAVHAEVSQILPRVVELHDEVINGKSKIPPENDGPIPEQT